MLCMYITLVLGFDRFSILNTIERLGAMQNKWLAESKTGCDI